MPEQIKIIFLDVDGVLNTKRTIRRTEVGWPFVGARYVKRLKKIIDATGAKIVLSSDWRYHRDDPSRNSDYLELVAELRKYGMEIYSHTPILRYGHRGEEIDRWLNDHWTEVGRFVILDDREDIEPNKKYWIRTTMDSGLTASDVETAIFMLNEAEIYDEDEES